jgi:hypothetical protein
MARVLIARHAEDVGGAIVEPGDPLPDNVDSDVVERLEAEGKLGDADTGPAEAEPVITKRGAK